jgi:hypothetical protein
MALLGGAFAVMILLVWIFQDRLVFLPPAVPAVQGRGGTRLGYIGSDGQQLFGFLFTPPQPHDSAAVAILLFHGNGDLADSWSDWAAVAAKRTRLPILLAEYRGYGGLPGRPTSAGVMHDARAAMDAVCKRYALRADQVILYGHSLGSGVATKLALERGARTLVLEAPMSSLVDMGRRSFGPPVSWALPLISRSPFNPLEQVRGLPVPIWIAVGGADEVIPPTMGRAIFEAAPHKGELLEIANASHGNISDRGGDRYWEWLERAVASVGSRHD